MNLITQTRNGNLPLIRDFIEQEFVESSGTVLIKGRVNLVERLGQITEQYQQAQQNSAIHSLPCPLPTLPSMLRQMT